MWRCAPSPATSSRRSSFPTARVARSSCGTTAAPERPTSTRSACSPPARSRPDGPAGGLKVCGAAHDQTFPSICADGIGGADLRPAGLPERRRRQHRGAARERGRRAALDGGRCDAVRRRQRADALPRVVADGLGGAIAVWRDLRNGADDNLYTRRISAAGTPMWTPDGVAVCTAASQQEVSGDDRRRIRRRDHGVARSRSGTDDIYAQRVSLGGAPQWAGNGVAVCTAANDQVYPTIASDNAGGAIVAWRDERNIGDPDIYAQRLNGAGVPLWTAQGVALCAAAGMQDAPAATEDGAGGAIVAWYDDRTASTDVYAQRVGAAGTMLWTANGAAVSTALQAQYCPAIAADPGLGRDHRLVRLPSRRQFRHLRPAHQSASGSSATRSPTSSRCATRPTIRADRSACGGRRSYLDQAPANPINEYWVWRQVPSTVALEAIARRAFATPESEGGDVLRNARRAIAPRSRPARRCSGNTSGARPRTGSPATAISPRPTATPRRAGTRTRASWSKPSRPRPDGSGTRRPTAATRSTTSPPRPRRRSPASTSPAAPHLHWGQNGEPDFGVYRIHRGATAGFTPGPSNLIATRNDTGYVDVGPAGGYYKLAAVDLHGNASAFAVLAPAGTVDAPDRALATELRLEPAFPNPSSGMTRLGFALPRAMALSLVIFDPQGRRVRDLARGVLPAGEHALRWDGRDGVGSSGGERAILRAARDAGARALGKVVPGSLIRRGGARRYGITTTRRAITLARRLEHHEVHRRRDAAARLPRIPHQRVTSAAAGPSARVATRRPATSTTLIRARSGRDSEVIDPRASRRGIGRHRGDPDGRSVAGFHRSSRECREIQRPGVIQLRSAEHDHGVPEQDRRPPRGHSARAPAGLPGRAASIPAS